MKVLQLTDKYITGGGLEYIYLLASGMPHIQMMVVGKTGSPPEKLQRLKNVACYVGGIMDRAVQDFTPDIVHTNHFRSLSSYNLASRAGRNKTILVNTVHGIHLHKFDFKTGLVNKIQFHARRILEGYFLRRTDENILLNSRDLSYAKRVFKITNGIIIGNGKPAFMCPQTFDSHIFDSKNASCVKFLTIARFNFQKGYDVLVNGIHKLIQIRPSANVIFYFVGIGEDFDKIQNLARVLNVDKYIRFLGGIENASSLMALADYLILPSRWEGFPITLLEAAAYKIPVIASDTYGNSDLIFDGKTGLLFKNENSRDLAELLALVLSKTVPFSGIGSALHNLVETKFTYQDMISKTESVYNKLCPLH